MDIEVLPKEQLDKIASVLNINNEQLINIWFAERIYNDLKEQSNSLDILKIVEERIKEKNTND